MGVLVWILPYLALFLLAYLSFIKVLYTCSIRILKGSLICKNKRRNLRVYLFESKVLKMSIIKLHLGWRYLLRLDCIVIVLIHLISFLNRLIINLYVYRSFSFLFANKLLLEVFYYQISWNYILFLLSNDDKGNSKFMCIIISLLSFALFIEFLHKLWQFRARLPVSCKRV